jgi:chromatin structure-remodeling complex protein RSC7
LLVEQRKLTWSGVYDPHTNALHYPKNSQPTHIKWEQLPVDDEDGGASQEPTANESSEMTDANSLLETPKSKFESVPPIVARNFLVTDTIFVSPAISGVGDPGPDGLSTDVGPHGLPDVASDLLDELPEDCREALLEAKKMEAEWKSQWSTESQDGMRGTLHIGYLGFPV